MARYTVNNNPNIANTNGTILLTISQPFNNYIARKLAFGADDYLYIASGNGDDPGNRAQNTNTLLGKILSIDVSGATYSNPSDNPYISWGD